MEQCASASSHHEFGSILKGTILQILENGRLYFITADGKGKLTHYIGPAKDWSDSTVKGCCGGLFFTKKFKKTTVGFFKEALVLGDETLTKNSNPGQY